MFLFRRVLCIVVLLNSISATKIVIPVADWPQYCCVAMNEEQLELAARLVCTVVINPCQQPDPKPRQTY